MTGERVGDDAHAVRTHSKTIKHHTAWRLGKGDAMFQEEGERENFMVRD